MHSLMQEEMVTCANTNVRRKEWTVIYTYWACVIDQVIKQGRAAAKLHV